MPFFGEELRKTKWLLKLECKNLVQFVDRPPFLDPRRRHIQTTLFRPPAIENCLKA